MRWSNCFIPTLRENPADAEVPSHQLLLRAGYIRQLAAGIYSYLPLAQRCMVKINAILREEFERIGAQEFYLPALHPGELWMQTGRWEAMGQNMFKLKDRAGRDLCLGMTHEEVFTSIARNELRSYKQLPQFWYQIQTKFRDEPRPKSGLLRVRQFTMKDSYSFDIDAAGLDKSYQKHYEAYCRTFNRCGLQYSVVEAHSGAMGGSHSHEFMVRSEAGEDLVVSCKCGYAANLERATSSLAEVANRPDFPEAPREVYTPGQKTIAEVAAFLEEEPVHQIKSLVYIVADQPVLILVRGDHELNEAKLVTATGTGLLRPAHEHEIRRYFGADAGSLGPVGVTNMRVLADLALQGRKNLTCGANKNDYHLQGVTPGLHFQAEFTDLRVVRQEEACTRCGAPLDVYKAVEVGHIFKLGTKYSVDMGATVLTHDGREVPIVMGSYGIGVERILAVAIELFHDADGIVLPASIAPYHAIITPVNHNDPPQLETAETLYQSLRQAGLEVLFDDRDERPGVKFKDADLIGIPFRFTVGPKLLKEKKVEFYTRATKKMLPIAIEEAEQTLRRALQAAMPSAGNSIL
jgi:prolyl-tRNA synthetase